MQTSAMEPLQELDDLLNLHQNEFMQLLTRSKHSSYHGVFQRLEAHKQKLDKTAADALKANLPAQNTAPSTSAIPKVGKKRRFQNQDNELNKSEKSGPTTSQSFILGQNNPVGAVPVATSTYGGVTMHSYTPSPYNSSVNNAFLHHSCFVAPGCNDDYFGAVHEPLPTNPYLIGALPVARPPTTSNYEEPAVESVVDEQLRIDSAFNTMMDTINGHQQVDREEKRY
jgi:hypothetical protein